MLAHEQPLQRDGKRTVHPTIGGLAGPGTLAGTTVARPKEMPTKGDCTHVVESKRELIDAVETDGATVYVPDDINVTGARNVWTGKDVTLVSGYCDPTIMGAGATIKQDYYHDHLFMSRGSSPPTLWGVSFEGPNKNYFDPQERAESADWDTDRPEDWYASAIWSLDTGGTFKLYGCHFSGWPWAGVLAGAKDKETTVDIDRCTFVNNQMESMGYGFEQLDGKASIKRSFFNANRHGTTSFGYPTCSYAVAYCVFGPDENRGHLEDMHGLANNIRTDSDVAGGYMNSYRNTYMGTWDAGNRANPDGFAQEAIVWRGIPAIPSYVDKCHFYHPNPPDDKKPNTQGQAIRQETKRWRNVDIRDNHYGKTLKAGFGAPLAPIRKPTKPEKPTPTKPSPAPTPDQPAKDERELTVSGHGFAGGYEIRIRGGDIRLGEDAELNDETHTLNSGKQYHEIRGRIINATDTIIMEPGAQLESVWTEVPIGIEIDEEPISVGAYLGPALTRKLNK